MAKRTFLLEISKNTDWYFLEENAKTVYDADPLKTDLRFGVMHQKDGKIISTLCQTVTKEDLEKAKKLELFQEEVKIKVKVDSGYPDYKFVSSETFEGRLIDALLYVYKINKEK